MNDLISRQAAIAEFKHYALYDSNRTNAEWVRRIELVLESLPTINPVKHGNWVGVDDEPHETFECDQCGYIYETYDGTIEWSFCPHCGAKMERSEDE